MILEGILPVHKPVDFTSHDVVGKVRRLLGIKRIGHTGTLDPKVTGVLPLCIGRATRVVEYIQDLPKEYEAVLTFGMATDTEDIYGTVISRLDRVELTIDQVQKAVLAFVGEIEQIPPMYSAVKIEGRRLYDLARQGIEVERKSRKVEIYCIQILRMDLDKPHPEVRFRVKCSKGTYIRTLCVDIGRALGIPAVMSHLVRTSSGSIQLAECVTLEQIEKMVHTGEIHDHIIATDVAIAHLPAVQVSAQEAVKALQGIAVLMPKQTTNLYQDQTLVRLYSDSKLFLGVFCWDTALQKINPVKVFN